MRDLAVRRVRRVRRGMARPHRAGGATSRARRSAGRFLLAVSLVAVAGITVSGRGVMAPSTAITALTTGIAITVSPGGTYAITARAPAWTFGGNVGHPLTHIAITSGADAIGAYKDITFQYRAGSMRRAGIRAYTARPVVLFHVTYLRDARNTAPFPVLTTYPRDLFYLSYSGKFGHYQFDRLGLGGAADSPRLLFDAHANAAIFSPAANAMVAATTVAGTTRTGGVALSSGITTAIPRLVAGFTQTTMLVIGRGINATFATWGRAMTDLQGKVRPPNDADAGLRYLGYWTDNAAAYYYNWEDSHRYRGHDPLDYAYTLLAVRDAFKRLGLPLRYMQLDSWWYPKGRTADWGIAGVIQHRGAYVYRAAPAIFPQGLGAFQRQLGLPLITHARWIDPGSPYVRAYRMSGDVSIDPRFWNDVISSLRSSGVMTYEQDWLGDPKGAHAANTIHDQDAFMTAMADATRRYGLSIQYCMPSARHYLQSARYGNVYTMRVSEDGFKDGLTQTGAVDDKWTPFLYDSRLASALGVWPFTDAIRTYSVPNLLLATLSGGMVGLADSLPELEKHATRARANLRQVVRTDSVIVKPDTPIVPIDAVYLEDARGLHRPMVAAAYTDHGGTMKAAYVFAYSRPRPDMPTTATFTPADLGFDASGRVYIYNYATRTGAPQSARQAVTVQAPAYQGTYDIVAPIGSSGLAFLGDTGKFASLGKQRIPFVSDDGRAVHATIRFATGEGAVTVSGYAAAAPTVRATYGAGQLRYDTHRHLFNVVVSPGSDGTTAVVSIMRHPGA